MSAAAFTTSLPDKQSSPSELRRRGMIRVVNLRPMVKGSLRALVDIELVRSGLILRSCAWFRNADGKEWVALPAQRYEGSDGVARFTPLVEFSPGANEARQRFQEAALKAIHAVAASDAAGTP
jgi:hypothetical protein